MQVSKSRWIITCHTCCYSNTIIQLGCVTHLYVAGSLPASWAKLSHMRELRLSNNMLTGAVPTAWRAGMQNLSLDLTGNQQMCGKMPTNWDLQVCKHVVT